MPRVLLISGTEKGHLNPLIGVAQWLARHGAEVSWLCLPDPPEQLENQPVEALAFPGSLPDRTTSGAALAALVRAEDRLRDWIRELLLAGVEDQLRGFKRGLDLINPDVIALDPMLYGAAIAAHKAKVPWISVSSSLNPVVHPSWRSALGNTIRTLSDERQALFQRHGLSPEFRLADCLSPYGTVVFACAALLGKDAVVPEGVHLVGPSVPPDPRGDECPLPPITDPLVYCSFGSQVGWQPEIYRRVAYATTELDLGLLIAAGPELARSDFGDSLPGRTQVVEYAPQRAVLQRAKLFITHMGANSLMEAAYAGVPMLASPICNDQPNNARLAEDAGVARRMDLSRATSQDIRELLEELLDPEQGFQRRAHDLQFAYRMHDGAHRAAELILQAAR